ncbi:MAG: hypothetical protein K6G26_12485 [Lachnospiraceae bacterium]|nr:hypothetical protein [Lachnospiraceae bacterium]
MRRYYYYIFSGIMVIATILTIAYYYMFLNYVKDAEDKINNDIELLKNSKMEVEAKKGALSFDTEEESNNDYEFYITALDNHVVVFYNDCKTIYEDTLIDLNSIPVWERENVINGIWVQDKDELAGILEGYSS